MQLQLLGLKKKSTFCRTVILIPVAWARNWAVLFLFDYVLELVFSSGKTETRKANRMLKVGVIISEAPKWPCRGHRGNLFLSVCQCKTSLSKVHSFSVDYWCYFKSSRSCLGFVLGVFCFVLFLITTMTCKFCFTRNVSEFSVWWIISWDQKQKVGSGHHLHLFERLRAFSPLSYCILQLLPTMNFLSFPTPVENFLSENITQRWVVCLL